MPVNGMLQMLMKHLLSTRIFSFTAPMQQKNNSANVRTDRFRLQSVPGPTGHSGLPHQHTTLPCRLCRIWGVKLLLGTDNVMFVPPDMFSEMAFTSAVYRIDPKVLLRAAVQGSELTGHLIFYPDRSQGKSVHDRSGTILSSFQPRSGYIHHKKGFLLPNRP